MTTPTLAAYLPVLTHPEHGEAICRAAGVRLMDSPHSAAMRLTGLPDDWYASAVAVASEKKPLGAYAIAALSHGIAAWLEETLADIAVGWAPGPDKWIVEWWNREQDKRQQLFFDTFPAALLAAAERVMGVE